MGWLLFLELLCSALLIPGVVPHMQNKKAAVEICTVESSV